MRKIYEGRLFNEMSQKYLTVERCHLLQGLFQFANYRKFF